MYLGVLNPIYGVNVVDTMNKQKLTTMTAAITIAAVGLLFLVPTETGLSFADTTTTTTGGDNGNSNSNSDKGSGDQQQQQQKTPDQPSSTPDQPDQPKTISPCTGICPPTGPVPPTPQPPKGCPSYVYCFPYPKWPKPIVIVHHDTKVVHESSSNNNRQLTVAQQNCMYSALQLGFSSNAQNRVDATYAAMMGCFS